MTGRSDPTRNLGPLGSAVWFIHLNELKREPFINFRDGREEILNAGGLDRVRLLLMYQLQEPRFDDPIAQLPLPNPNNEEILTLVDFFLRADQPQVEEVDRTSETAEKTSLTSRIRDFLPYPVSRRHIAYAVVAGVLVGWMSLGGVYLLRHFYRQH